MNDLIQANRTSEVCITLKEITDLISVEHNKAMKVVNKLMLEPNFGTVDRIATVYNSKGQTIDTYMLSKKQAIAVGAKLNNTLLMKVVDKVEELTKQPQKVLTVPEQISLIAQGHQETDKRLTVLEQTKRLENWQEKSLQDAKDQKVYEIAQDNKELASKLHRKVWSLFKKQFHLPRYNELPSIKYQNGLDFIRNLSFADMV